MNQHNLKFITFKVIKFVSYSAQTSSTKPNDDLKLYQKCLKKIMCHYVNKDHAHNLQ